MIADSGVLANSNRWSNDVWKESNDYVYHDSTLLDLQGMDLDLTSLESEIERVHYQNQMSPFALGMDSRGASVASSECSDELSLEMDGHLEEILFSSNPGQLLSTSLHSLLDLGEIPSTLEWSDYDLSEDLSNPDKHSSTDNKPTISHCPQHRKLAKTWSVMSSEEQIEKVEQISRVISNELGLREQLEVIRLINPAADVSSTDKEFVIDLESINEEKLEKIEDFIKLHIEDNLSDNSSAHSNSPQKKQTKKPCKDRKSQHKTARQRQRKEYRQMMKEKRSGLFVKEEVMALSVCEPIEEAEVDILM